MIHRVSTSIGLLVLGGSLALPQAQSQKPAAPPQQQDDLPPVLSVPKDYHYTARGRRDPFVNPVPKPVKTETTPPARAVRPPGLRGVLVTEAEIIGIVVSREPSMNVVTIAAPGGKRYFARIGDSLFDAVLKGIRADSVTFTVTAPGDPSAPKEIVRKMRGENK